MIYTDKLSVFKFWTDRFSCGEVTLVLDSPPHLSVLRAFFFQFNHFLDAYPTHHLIYAWKSTPGVVVLDKEMAQFYMKNMTTAVQRVKYVAGE